jgi:hypothetical protein
MFMNARSSSYLTFLVVLVLLSFDGMQAFAPSERGQRNMVTTSQPLFFGTNEALSSSTVSTTFSSSPSHCTRRAIFTKALVAPGMALVTIMATPQLAAADSAAVQDSLNIDNFLRTGVDAGGNMGVSSQAGKSRPQTGVVFRDGSEVSQDKAGTVSAELLTGTKASPKAVLVTFRSPLKLETGPVFDVECRDSKSGDGAFLAVSKAVPSGKSLSDLPNDFLLERLFDPTGRFSFYGPPTDIRVKSNTMVERNRRILEVTFSNLSQSTNAEIPRRALLVATLPEGTDNVIMLVASANANRWNKGSEQVVRTTGDSFRAVAAPKSNLKLRAKDRSNQLEF